MARGICRSNFLVTLFLSSAVKGFINLNLNNSFKRNFVGVQSRKIIDKNDSDLYESIFYVKTEQGEILETILKAKDQITREKEYFIVTNNKEKPLRSISLSKVFQII